MASASFQFLGFALAVVLVFNLGRGYAWRQTVLLVANLGFIASFSLRPDALLPLACFLAFGFLSLRRRLTRKAAALPLLLVAITGFIWIKKYAFIPSFFLLHTSYVTIGLSYILFRVLHLIVDSGTGVLPRNITLLSYLNYTLNFTTLVSGPIQRYEDFAELQRVPLPTNMLVVGSALERIVIGFFKVNVLSLFFSMTQARALLAIVSAPHPAARIFAGVLIATSYPLYLYCNFSGYIDIVIGIARCLRSDLPENFDRPFSSADYLTFWNRWHITLSTWLKTYVYNPLLLALMRRCPAPSAAPFLGAFAFFITFFLVGVWHGQTSVFIFFGVLQGFGVSLTKLYQTLMANWMGRKRYKQLARHWLYHVAGRGLTFTWFTFSLLWFWSNWTQLANLARLLRAREIALLWGAVFFGSAMILACWEAVRESLLPTQIRYYPLFASRYARTAWATGLAVIGIATLALLNSSPPDIVYKAF